MLKVRDFYLVKFFLKKNFQSIPLFPHYPLLGF